MWDCGLCGAQQIAGDLVSCPHCGRERTEMPKISTSGGATNYGDHLDTAPGPEAEQEPELDGEQEQPQQGDALSGGGSPDGEPPAAAVPSVPTGWTQVSTQPPPSSPSFLPPPPPGG